MLAEKLLSNFKTLLVLEKFRNQKLSVWFKNEWVGILYNNMVNKSY